MFFLNSMVYSKGRSPISGCYFNGKVYTKGQKFDDGCDYHCVCVDDMTGQYSCTKR